MGTTTGRGEIEQRLTAIEAELAALRANSFSSPPKHPVHLLEKLHGTFENDQAFKEAVRLGRQWRTADRPKRRVPKAKRK